MKLTVPIKIDGIPFVKKAIRELFDTSEFKDDVPEEYRNGAYEFGQAIINTLDKLDRHGGWIPCRERLPENEQEVEITYVKKHWKTGEPLYFTCRAFYSDGTVNTEESNYVWDETDNWEYIEKMDAYIIPEGWWECVSFAEEFAAVDMPVIAWMPLPEPYELRGEKA